jgi:uncharacterized protein
MTQQTLPLFPLNTVLFPGTPLTLHIFEERYRTMIARCLEQQSPFGVVLIREGDEVVEGNLGNQAAQPCEIGTIAQISANVKLDDGRYIITAIGQRRFRIQYLLHHEPYLIGSVALLSEDRPPMVIELASELRQTCDRYWRAVVDATGVQVQPDTLPDDVAAMSYQLADRLQVPRVVKQRWLEADLSARLREMNLMLKAELAMLPRSQRGAQPEGWAWSGSLN